MSDKGPIEWFGKCNTCGHVNPVRRHQVARCSTYVSRPGYTGECPGTLTKALDSCGCLKEHSQACRTYCGPD